MTTLPKSRFEPIIRANDPENKALGVTDENVALLNEFTKLFDDEEFNTTVPITKEYVKKIVTEEGETVAVFLFLWTEEQENIDNVVTYSTYVQVPKKYSTLCPQRTIQTLTMKQKQIWHNVYFLPNGLPIAWVSL